jgi:hypothetical protein
MSKGLKMKTYWGDWPVECSASWSEEDLQRLKDFRRRVAREEQASDTKEVKRDCQKFVKASTTLLEHFYGVKPLPTLPQELYLYILISSSKLWPPYTEEEEAEINARFEAEENENERVRQALSHAWEFYCNYRVMPGMS